MLRQYTFGQAPIPYAGLTATEVFMGSEYDSTNSKPYYTTASDAGAIDLKAGNQMYSDKARFNVFVLESVLPVDNGSGTAYNITFKLQHCDTANGTFTDLVSTVIPCEALAVASGVPAFEIGMPSNCKRFVRLSIDGDTGFTATAGKLLCAIEPKN